MYKALLIILSSALALYGIESDSEIVNDQSAYVPNNDSKIAREKSGFFIGGSLGSRLFERSISSKGSVTEGTPGKISNLTCVPTPGGGISCAGSGGVSIKPGSLSTTTFEYNPNTKEGSSLNYGGRLGYNYFFTPRNGLRFIASFQANNFDLDSLSYLGSLGAYKLGVLNSKDHPFYTASIGLDYLFDFTKGRSPFGLFAGVGYDFNFGKMFDELKKNALSKSDVTTSGTYINLGISQTILRRVRIDLGYKIFFYDYFDGNYKIDSLENLSGGKIRETHIGGVDKISSGGMPYIALDILF